MKSNVMNNLYFFFRYLYDYLLSSKVIIKSKNNMGNEYIYHESFQFQTFGM